jgi:hypothetical protein
MLLTKYYRLVTASGNFSGWITPDGEFLRNTGEGHEDTLREHDIDLDHGEAIREGYTWLNHLPTWDTVECELHYSRFNSVKRILKRMIGDKDMIIKFELFNDRGRRVKEVSLEYAYGDFF